jgi:hypothetical protein
MVLTHADEVTVYNKNCFSGAYDSSMESQQPSNHFSFSNDEFYREQQEEANQLDREERKLSAEAWVIRHKMNYLENRPDRYRYEEWCEMEKKLNRVETRRVEIEAYMNGNK